MQPRSLGTEGSYRTLAVALAKLRLKDMTGAECKVLLQALRDHALDLLIQEMQANADRAGIPASDHSEASEVRAQGACEEGTQAGR